MLKIVRKVKRWFNYRIHGTKKPWLYRSAAAAPLTAEDIFTHIYANNSWGDPESVSGVGSNLTQTKVLRERLPSLLQELHVQTMLDIPCGDYFWLSQVEPNVAQYLGADIVGPLVASNQARYARQGPQRTVEFAQMNLLTATLPRVDLILCRDCLVHFSTADVQQALRQIKRSGSTYLLTTTYPAWKNEKDIRTGEWRALNLEAPPFSLPKPLLTSLEGCTERNGRFPDKTLALWKIADLP